MNRTFKPGYWNSAPGPWLSLLVPAVVLALLLVCTGHCQETKPLIPQDFPAAEYLLRQHDIFGQVIEGEIIREGETQTLTCRVRVGEGNIQTVIIQLTKDRRHND